MIINVRVVPHARRNQVTVEENGILRVYTTVAPVDGAANEAVIKMLAEHFKVPKTSIKIIRGVTARNKVIEI